MKYKPYEYQQAAARWIKEKPRCALFLDMGLGKTVITLTALREMLDDGEISRVLIVAPKKVAESTWSAETQKWDHLRGTQLALVLGNEKQRTEALASQAEVYVTGRDNFVWLVEKYNGSLPFDMLVIDELTSFKTPTSARFKAMRIVAPAFVRTVGLTGTPAPNGLIDLWSQIYCLDGGARLGKMFSRYRDTYFDQHRWNNIIVRCTPKKGTPEEIKNKISDICLSMQASDYLHLPDMITHTIRIQLSEQTMKRYRDFERERVMDFKRTHTEETTDILANSAAGLVNKLSQFSNGAVYDDERVVHEIHDEKLEHLVTLVEAANGNSVLVFYQYKHDADRIMRRLKGYQVRMYNGIKEMDDWNNGRIDVMLAHPASTAYGLNLQEGGHFIVWFGTGWNLEQYLQANARLHRQGQRHPVIVYRLLCAGTVDERAATSLTAKKSVQQGLLDELKYLMDKYQDAKTN